MLLRHRETERVPGLSTLSALTAQPAGLPWQPVDKRKDPRPCGCDSCPKIVVGSAPLECCDGSQARHGSTWSGRIRIRSRPDRDSAGPAPAPVFAAAHSVCARSDQLRPGFPGQSGIQVGNSLCGRCWPCRSGDVAGAATRRRRAVWNPGNRDNAGRPRRCHRWNGARQDAVSRASRGGLAHRPGGLGRPTSRYPGRHDSRRHGQPSPRDGAGVVGSQSRRHLGIPSGSGRSAGDGCRSRRRGTGRIAADRRRTRSR